MQGVEVAYLRNAMDALREARRVLCRQFPADALRSAAGKHDTIMFDAITENVIVDRIRSFNNRSVILTEESGRDDAKKDSGKDDAKTRIGTEDADRTCYFIDPLDGSDVFRAALMKCDQKPLGELFETKHPAFDRWDVPVGSITCVRQSEIIFNAMIHYVTGELYVACRAMRKHANIDIAPDPESMARIGQDIVFEPREGTEYTCFIGAVGTEKRKLYEKHLEDLPIAGLRRVGLDTPGGPARILCLTDLVHTQLGGQSLSVILSNGEKMCEWFGWLAYVVHSKDLAAYELQTDRFSERDGMLMAPPPSYSMFTIPGEGRRTMNLERILVHERPLNYRCALVVSHIGSTDVIAYLRSSKNCRALTF